MRGGHQKCGHGFYWGLHTTQQNFKGAGLFAQGLEIPNIAILSFTAGGACTGVHIFYFCPIHCLATHSCPTCPSQEIYDWILQYIYNHA
jgi:hypothetical protein